MHSRSQPYVFDDAMRVPKVPSEASSSELMYASSFAFLIC